MPELREKLNLPLIEGDLVAVAHGGQFDWEIIFTISGPDARYNPGLAMMKPGKLDKFINTIDQSLEKARKLESISFTGEFSQKFDDCTNPTIEVKSLSGSIEIHFWVQNNTKWRFSKVLTVNQLASVLEILKTVRNRAKNLIANLKILQK